MNKRRLMVEVTREVVVEKPVDPAQVYAFRTVVRCPRCGSNQTRVIDGPRASRPDIRYRMCSVAVCRFRFKEVGVLVE